MPIPIRSTDRQFFAIASFVLRYPLVFWGEVGDRKLNIHHCVEFELGHARSFVRFLIDHTAAGFKGWISGSSILGIVGTVDIAMMPKNFGKKKFLCCHLMSEGKTTSHLANILTFSFFAIFCIPVVLVRVEICYL